MGTSRRTRGIAAALAMGLVAAACGGGGDSGGKTASASGDEGTPVPGGRVIYALEAETNAGWCLPEGQLAIAGIQVARTIYDTLVQPDESGKMVPMLAESIEPNDDYTTWTITLRPNITFHDGSALDAAAVKTQLDADVASFLVGQAFKSVKDVVVVDDLTVEVNMNEPWVAFPAVLAAQGGYVAAPKQLNATGSASTDKPIGTGPYVFKEWVRDDHLTLTRNPNYWRKDVAYPETITFRPIPDDQTRLQSIQSGDLDLTYTAVASQILAARRDRSLALGEYDADSLQMLMMNMAKAPVDDLRVREAIVYAVDQQELITIVGRDLSQKATSPYAKGSPWFAESGYPTEPDLAKARGLIDDYKKDKGISGDLSFDVGCTPTPSNKQAMTIVKTQLAKVGIAIDVKYTEQATYINNALNGDYVVNCWAQLGASDPDGDSVWWKSVNANPPGQLALNFMRMKDPEVDAALQEGHSNPDPKARQQAYATVWKRFAAVYPYAYFSHPHGAVIWSKD